jgi:hypothetical protein
MCRQVSWTTPPFLAIQARSASECVPYAQTHSLAPRACNFADPRKKWRCPIWQHWACRLITGLVVAAAAAEAPGAEALHLRSRPLESTSTARVAPSPPRLSGGPAKGPAATVRPPMVRPTPGSRPPAASQGSIPLAQPVRPRLAYPLPPSGVPGFGGAAGSWQRYPVPSAPPARRPSPPRSPEPPRSGTIRAVPTTRAAPVPVPPSPPPPPAG